MRKILLALMALILPSVVLSAQSCYDMFKVESRPDSSVNTSVFILIDETTLFDDGLKRQVINNAIKKLQPGNHFYVAKFSAFIDNNYNQKVFEFTLDKPLEKDARFNERKDVLRKLDKCLNDQYNYVGNSLQKSIFESFKSPEKEIPKSDILYALKDFGTTAISQSPANEKIVIIASDMLENSTITSFYSKGTSRNINPQNELKIVEKNSLFSDFGGAKIYIVGAGIISSGKTGTYRDPKVLSSLKSFWDEYFSKSNGVLIEMGQPALKKEIE